VLLPWLVAGCGALSAPEAVRPALRDVEALGYRCEAGEPDNVPSGLFQWRCPGTVDNAPAVVQVIGNDDGVVEVVLSINSVEPKVAREEFRRLADAVTPLSGQPGLSAALDAWTGAQAPTRIGDVRVNAECDVTQCIVYMAFADYPPQPSG